MTTIAEAGVAVKVVKDGIGAASDAIDLYNKVLDQVIPWKEFDSLMEQLTKHEKDYSTQAGTLVGEVKTLLMNSRDEYRKSTQTVYEWCGLAVMLLSTYLKLFDKYDEKKAEAQKKILLKILGEGVTKMETAQDSLRDASESMNTASGQLSALNTQLANDFDSKSSYFKKEVNKLRAQAYTTAGLATAFGPFGLVVSYTVTAGIVEAELIPALNKKCAQVKDSFKDLLSVIEKSDTEIDSAKIKLETEVITIGNMKVQTQATEFYVEYDDIMLDILKVAASELIGMCNEYMKSHE